MLTSSYSLLVLISSYSFCVLLLLLFWEAIDTVSVALNHFFFNYVVNRREDIYLTLPKFYMEYMTHRNTETKDIAF